MLSALDAEGYPVIDALAHDKAPPIASHASPHRFACSDGALHWVKRTAQHGLACELIAGRLAGMVNAGPVSAVVRVPTTALPTDGSANHLEGLGVGFLEQPATMNTKEVVQLTGKPIDGDKLDKERHALVVVFSSWLAIGDPQALVDLNTGRLYGIDYGDALGNPHDTTAVPSLVSVQGVPATSHAREHLAAAVDGIEGVSNDQVLAAVARVPDESSWQGDRSRRCQIARWLVDRRDKLRGALAP